VNHIYSHSSISYVVNTFTVRRHDNKLFSHIPYTCKMSLPQLFGVIPTGFPIIISPTSSPSQTSFVYNLPARSFSHIAIFLLPGITLPPNSAAAVYIAFPSSQSNFKFLGGIGPGKESAIFKVNGLNSSAGPANGEVDMDAPEGGSSSSGEIILGIDIETAESVSAQMASLSSSNNNTDNSSALVVANRSSAPQPTNTVLLAQRIIKNAFNFLASFSGNVPVPGGSGTAGVEVVPLKAFEDWWKKFETRVRSDPTFLEKDVD